MAADFNLDGHTDLYVTSAGYNVPTDALGRAALERRRRDVHRGRRPAGHRRARLALGAAVGDVNGDGRPDLFVSSYTDPNFVVDPASGFPSEPRTRPRSPLPERGTGRERALDVPRGRASGGHREDEGRPRPRRGVHGLQPRRTARPVRRERRRPEPALPKRRAEGGAPTLSASASRTSRSARTSPTRTRAWESPPRTSAGDGRTDLFVTNSRGQLHAAYRSLRATTGPSFADARPEFAAAIGIALDGLGRVVGRPRPRRRPRPRPGERRDPGREPREGRAARPDPRERRPGRASEPRFASVEAARGSRARPR